MAKINRKRLFEDNITAGIIADFEKFSKKAGESINTLKEDTKELKKVLDTIDFSKISDVKKLQGLEKQLLENADAINELNRRSKEAVKLKQEEEKLRQQELNTAGKILANIQKEQRIKAATEKQIKDEIREREKLAIQAERKLKQDERQAAKTKDQNRISNVLKKRLRDLKKEYEDLTLSQGLNAEGANILKDEIESLEGRIKEVSGSLRNVKKEGNQVRGVFGKIGTAIKASGIGLLVAAIAGIGDSFKSTREGGAQFDKLFNRLTATFKVLSASIIESIDAIKSIISNTGVRFQIFGKQIQKTFLSVQAIFSDTAEEGVKKLDEEIEALQNSLSSGASNIIKLAGAFSGLGDKIDNVINSNDQLIEQTISYTIEIENLERQLTKIRREQELNNSIADDATLSFKARISANKALIDSNLQVSKAEQRVAEERLKLAEQAVKTEFAQSGIVLKSRQQIINALENERTARKISDEVSRQFTDAFISYEEAKTAALTAEFEQQKQLRELRQDLLERDLDILLDGSDNQKTINERIIANDKETLERRRAVFNDTKKMLDDSFRDQKEVLAQLSDAGIDIDALLELDSIALAKRIRELEQSEIIEGRTLEVVRERRLVLQDLLEAEQDLIDKEAEANKLRLEIEAQNRLLNDFTKENSEQLSDDLLQIEIDSIKQRLEAVKAGSLERLQLEKELNDLLIDQKQTAVDKEKEQEEKRREEQKQAAENLTDFILKQEEIRKNARLKAQEETVTEQQKEVDRQFELAKEGLQNSFAEEKAELEKQKLEKRRLQEEEEKRQRRAVFIDFVKAFAETDPKNATREALIKTLEVFAVAGAFKDGVEGIQGPGTTTSDSIPIWVSREESVITAKATDNNKGLATALNKGFEDDWIIKNKAYLMPKMAEKSNSNNTVVTVMNENRELVKELKSMNKTILSAMIANKPLSDQFKEYNRRNRAI